MQRGCEITFTFPNAGVRETGKIGRREGKSYDTKESSRGNYYRSFRHDECFLASVLNGSSVSGDVTNNIDLPVNGIISQSARRGRAAYLLRGAGAFARRRNKCLH